MTPITDTAHEDADQAVVRAVSFLRARQFPHGEFATYVGANTDMSGDLFFDSSSFFTSFVVYGLTHVHRAVGGDVLEKAVSFLRSEMEFGGLWRYWTSRQYKHCRMPPDLDDVACISYALRTTGNPVPRNRWFFASRKDPVGRYYVWAPLTWQSVRMPWYAFVRSVGAVSARIRSRNAPVPSFDDPRHRIGRLNWNEVDPVVNANVILYLGERPETLPAIQYVIASVLDESSGRGLWYQERLALYHAAARAFRHSSPSLAVVREHIVERIGELCEAPDRLNPLQMAMAASALQTFTPTSGLLLELIRSIRDAQRTDGGWKACPFYNLPGTFWGSEELTTGFCLEVLARAALGPDVGD
jgi:hypothetical protein